MVATSVCFKCDSYCWFSFSVCFLDIVEVSSGYTFSFQPADEDEFVESVVNVLEDKGEEEEEPTTTTTASEETKEGAERPRPRSLRRKLHKLVGGLGLGCGGLSRGCYEYDFRECLQTLGTFLISH